MAAAAKLTAEEEADLRETFRMFDIDDDGSITLVEMKEVLRQLGHNPSEKQLMAMIREVDVDGDHEIDFDEFVVLMQKSNKRKKKPSKPSKGGRHRDHHEHHEHRDHHDESERDRELRMAFRTFDEDGDGSVSRKELKRLMRKLNQALSEEELDIMMDMVDVNGDGEISFEEFKMMMT